ncbi:MAG: hypothetical protein K2K56_07465 [Lachnospiraceae bacterium]|nr:hypothetical protein [Lachnospiraceae bacterium]
MDSEFIKLLTEMAQEQFIEDNPAAAADTADRLEYQTYLDLTEHNISPDVQGSPSGIRMPAYLKEQIITRAAQPDMQIHSAPRRFSKRMELFIYGCKVTAAVAACLVMIVTFSATQSRFPSQSDQTGSLLEADFTENTLNSIVDQLNNGSRSITSWLQNLSSDIMNNKK